MSFEHNVAGKNFNQNACFRRHARFFLREMDKKFKFYGTIGYWASYLEYIV